MNRFGFKTNKPRKPRLADEMPRARGPVGLSNLWRRLGPVRQEAPAIVGGPQARDERLCRLEAALFLAREPMTTRRLAKLAALADGTEARSLLRRLNGLYDQSGTAFRVEQVAGGYQLLTRPIFGPWLRRLIQAPIEARLSTPAMETLAVVAYRQPAGRAAIEAIRGVQCSDILRQLMDRDLVRIVGRSDDLGRPLLYGTTKRFLQLFGLRDLEELPMADQLRRPADVDEPPDAAVA